MNPLSRDTALLEILIMLVVSFVLGYVTRWYSSCGHSCCEGETTSVTPTHAKKPSVAPTTQHSVVAKKDDLKRIEGIGPAIEKLLNNDGILTYAQVAEATPARLKAILEKAGPQFALHECETWPQQSALARDGKWVEFEALLAKLIHGKQI